MATFFFGLAAVMAVGFACRLAAVVEVVAVAVVVVVVVAVA
jgi:hypothetical protein